MTAPDIDAAEARFNSIKGRFYEPRVAAFFLFDQVVRAGDVLRVTGRIRSFTVSPAEAGGNAFLNRRPYKDTVTITIRAGEPWAEVSARRVGDLRMMRTVLRRTEAMRPALGLKTILPLDQDPFSGWDVQTLWVLDFLRRDLQGEELSLKDTVMAHFVAPDAIAKMDAAVLVEEQQEDDEEDDQPAPPPTPAVDTVRLRGTLLHDHPDACVLISNGARLRDLELSIRRVTNAKTGASKLVRFRLVRENDNLAIFSGASDGKVDGDLHREIVGLVRKAADRRLDEPGLAPWLKAIANTADSGEFDESGGMASVTSRAQPDSQTAT